MEETVKLMAEIAETMLQLSMVMSKHPPEVQKELKSILMQLDKEFQELEESLDSKPSPIQKSCSAIFRKSGYERVGGGGGKMYIFEHYGLTRWASWILWQDSKGQGEEAVESSYKRLEERKEAARDQRSA